MRMEGGEGAAPGKAHPLLSSLSLSLSTQRTVPRRQDEGRVAAMVGLVEGCALCVLCVCEEKGEKVGQRKTALACNLLSLSSLSLGVPRPASLFPSFYLLDVLLHPVVVPVHAVPPDVGFLGHEDAGL